MHRHARLSLSLSFAGLLAGLPVTEPAAQAVNNVLTPAETAAGWQSLFDGKSNAGWIRPNGSAGRFVVEDSALRTNGGDICTQGEYADYEVSIDYRYDAGGNSGIFVRTKKGIDPPWLNGMEVAIQDNGRAGNLYKNGDAAVYDVIAPSKDTWRGPMKWNTIVIWLSGSKLEHWHNGQKVVDQDMASAAFKAAVAASKFSDATFTSNNWGKETKGQVCLQDHGPDHKIWFRNMKIRTLTPGGALPKPFATPAGGSFPGPVTVTLDPAVVGAAVHYTLDGSEPTAASPRYSVPIALTAAATLKAISVRTGAANSPVTTQTYAFGPSAVGPAAKGPSGWSLRRGAAGLRLSLQGASAPILEVQDVRGRVVTLSAAADGSFDLASLPSGVYGFRAGPEGGSFRGRFALP